MNTDRDDVLRRVNRVNPAPAHHDLPDDLADSRPPLTLLIEEGGDMQDPTKTRAAPRWRGPAIAAGALVAALAIAVPLLLLRGGGEDVAAPETTVPGATTTAPAGTTLPSTTQAPSTTTAATTTTLGSTATTTLPPAQTAVAWERVPEQPSLQDAVIASVVEFDGRLFAAGYVLEEGAMAASADWPKDAAVWVSDDGTEWDRIEAPDAFGGAGQQAIRFLAAGPNGLLAVGDVDYDINVVWVSGDGETWEPVTGFGRGWMYDVIWSEAGWVAVGFDLIEGARVWLSPDGREWTVAEVSDPLRSEDAYITRIYGITDTGSGFVAVGDDEAGEHEYQVTGYSRCAAIWYSETGTTWARIPDPDVCAEEEAFADVTTNERGEVTAYGIRALWTSSDPADPGSWNSIAGSGDQSRHTPQAWIGDVGVAIAWYFPGADLVFVTDDSGATWSPVDRSSAAFDGHYLMTRAAVAFDDRFVCVGEESAGTLPGAGVVWIGTVE